MTLPELAAWRLPWMSYVDVARAFDASPTAVEKAVRKDGHFMGIPWIEGTSRPKKFITRQVQWQFGVAPGQTRPDEPYKPVPYEDAA